MRTPFSEKDPFKRGPFPEILAASIMYKRPVHIHIMDLTPEYRISNDQSISEHLPIRLSYEGRNHYNARFPKDHQFHKIDLGYKRCWSYPLLF